MFAVAALWACGGSGNQVPSDPLLDPLDEVDPTVPVAPVVTEEERPPERSPEERVEPAEAPVAEEEVIAEEEERAAETRPPKELWEEYQHERRFDCVGPFDTMGLPYTFPVRGRNVTIHGHWMTVDPPDWGPQDTLKVGVIGAPKDSYPETLSNLRRFLRWFDKHEVPIVVLNGDVAYEARDMGKSLELLARTRKLVWVMAGNADPVSPMNRVLKELSREWPNLVNGNHVRRVELDGHTLISLPGYHDSEFITAGSGCQYYRSDVKALSKLLDAAKGTPVLVSHGPPRGRGKKAMDFAFDAGNVGDKRLGDFMRKRRVAFGIFGHILEAGTRTMTAYKRKPIKKETHSPTLYVNVGGASSLLTDLHTGESHRGMAAIVELEKSRARVLFDLVPDD